MASTPFSSPNTESGGKQGKPGRKASKAPRPPTKKQLKRGMGVEALERLILQEKWRKMTASTASTAAGSVEPAVSVPVHQGTADNGGAGNSGIVSAAATLLNQSGSIQYPTTHFVEPAVSVPMQKCAADYSEAGNNGVISGWIKTAESAASTYFAESQSPRPQGGAVIGIPANIGGIWGWNGGMLVQQRAGNDGFNGWYTTEHESDHPGKADGIPDFRAQFSNPVYETSKELSSMPNLQQYLPVYRCDVCLKKKRWNGNNAVINGVMMIDNSSSPVFHQQNNENNNGSYRGKRIFSGYSGQIQNLPGMVYGNAQSFNGGQINGGGIERPKSYNHSGIFHFETSKNLNQGELNGFKSYNPAQGTARRDPVFTEHEFFRSENISSKESAFSGAISTHGEASNPYYVDLSLKL